jgi:hypothetical protein
MTTIDNKATIIKKEAVLLEKPSGNYSCPHFIPPNVALEIAGSCGVALDEDASKALAEVAENFALEVLRNTSSKTPSAEMIRNVITGASFV